MQKHSFEGLQRMDLHNFNCLIETELIGQFTLKNAIQWKLVNLNNHTMIATI